MCGETLLLLRNELDYCVLFSLAAQMTKSTTVMGTFFIYIKSFYGESFFLCDLWLLKDVKWFNQIERNLEENCDKHEMQCKM